MKSSEVIAGKASVIVPCDQTSIYRNAPGSVCADGRCGLRSILQYLLELLGMKRFKALLHLRGISLPPNFHFAWGQSRVLCVWLDELWQKCFSEYLRLIISEKTQSDVNSPLALISSGDIERNKSGRLVHTGECERIQKEIFANTSTIGNKISGRLMDERTGYVIGSLLNVNIDAIQQGRDPQPFYEVATSEITVSLNYDGRHFDIQGHQPHDPPDDEEEEEEEEEESEESEV